MPPCPPWFSPRSSLPNAARTVAQSRQRGKDPDPAPDHLPDCKLCAENYRAPHDTPPQTAKGTPIPKPHETLEGIALLRSLDAKQRAAFERRCQWRHAKAKEWLLEQNDVGTDIYFLSRGVVRVLITPSPDREVILGDIEAGGYFGEMAAIDGQPRSAGILAVTDATIACMAAPVFRELVRQHPDVSELLLRQLVARIRTLDQRVDEFSSMQVKHRIYAELLRRSRPDPEDRRRAVVSPPPVHSDIAARVSTRREMVARELKALERAGLLTKRRGAFVLTNVPELMEMLRGGR
jgi:CRP-like cAMP-binding protein